MKPVAALTLDPLQNKTGRIWHCFVPQYGTARDTTPTGSKARAGVLHQFDAQKVLLDPFAEEVFFPPDFSRAAAMQPGANDGRAPLGVLPVKKPITGKFARPRHPWHEIVVYELHVKRFHGACELRRDERRNAGRFSGLIEKIPYLKELGVTVVELLPVHQFDPQEGNYWGYMTLNFFAPHHGYAVRDAAAEFREMVRAFHAAGIEVWLDVVYNHTVRGRSERADLFVARDRQQQLLPAPAGWALLERQRLREHAAVRPRRARACSILQSLRHWAESRRGRFSF